MALNHTPIYPTVATDSYIYRCRGKDKRRRKRRKFFGERKYSFVEEKEKRTRPSVNHAKDCKMAVNLVNQGQPNWKRLKRKILDEFEIVKEDVKDIVAIAVSTEGNAEFTPTSKI